MNILQNLRLALRGLSGNKMRSGLTMLGIIIGVGVVIIVVAIGQGATQQVTQAVNSLGTNLLSIRPGRPRARLVAAVSKAATTTTGSGSTLASSPNRLTLDDAKLIAVDFRQSIAAIAPQSRGNAQIRLGSNNATTSVIGTTPDYLYVNNAAVDRGRFFTGYEGQGAQKVCVVGTTVADKLTGSASTDLTGKTISLNRQNFLVIGMLTPKGAGAFGDDQDDTILMPIETAMRRVFNRPSINFLSVRCVTPEAMPLAQEQISQFLRNRHHLRPPFPDNDDFQITSQTELMERQQSVTGTMTTLLSAVAVISLIVGGIGIMNIMLVSVTERTREIGIRKAIGATPRDILLQFLIESSILSLLGGLAGIVLGIGGAVILAAVAGWNTVVSSTAIIAALVVSAGVGIFFGIYPAGKAAALNPIEALRFE